MQIIGKNPRNAQPSMWVSEFSGREASTLENSCLFLSLSSKMNGFVILFSEKPAISSKQASIDTVCIPILYWILVKKSI